MKSNYIIICFLLLFIKGALSQNLRHLDEKVDGQIIEGLLGVNAGAKNTVINLDGIWKFSLNPPANFWINTDTPENWSEIHVPGECQMQGFSIKSDQEFAYRKEILIPASFKNKKLLIRFDGVYSYARVWVNGIFIREHFCGFTTWYCDITRAVTPGQKAVINVGVTDLNYDLSFGKSK